MFRRGIATLALAALPCLALAQELPTTLPDAASGPVFSKPLPAELGTDGPPSKLPSVLPSNALPLRKPEASSVKQPPATESSISSLPYPMQDEGPVYVIYLRILEGTPGSFEGLDDEEALERWLQSAADGTTAVESFPQPRDLPLPVANPPVPVNGAPQPQPSPDLQPQPETPVDAKPLPTLTDALQAESKDEATEKASRWSKLMRELLGHPQIEILAAPKLAVIEKQEAQVQIASQQVFTYLVPVGNDRYEARRTEPQVLGIHVQLTVRPTEDPEIVELSPIEMEVTSLDGREPVKGLDLDVGKPIVTSRSIKTSLQVPLAVPGEGPLKTLRLPSGSERDAILFIEVERLDEPVEKVHAKWKSENERILKEANPR